MLRVRFAPSPTGYLHIGSARTFILNWLFARHNGGAMILRLDDTDVERNTQESVDSIFEGLKWLDLSWDEYYRQSERGELHTKLTHEILAKDLAYRDFTPLQSADISEPADTHTAWLFNAEMRNLTREESDRRAAAGEPFVVRYRVPRDSRANVTFDDAVYGPQSKATADIEDFALLRSSGVPTYHMASCADDADLHISHIIRGQDHLTNTFKHVLIFEALGVEPPQFAHLPLLIAPDGSKLSKRKHGPVVSVTTYRDAGFLPQAFINFVCLLGWSPKGDREKLSRQELIDLFTLEGVNRSNATLNFKEEEPFDPKSLLLTKEETFDPKAVWLNAEYIRSLPLDELAKEMLPFAQNVGYPVNEDRMGRIAPLLQERVKLLYQVGTVGDFFFRDVEVEDPAELIPQKGDAAMAATVLAKAEEVLATAEFTHDGLDHALRGAAGELKIKAGQMFQPIRVAVCGRKNAPPLFETLEVLGRDVCLKRVALARTLLKEPV